MRPEEITRDSRMEKLDQMVQRRRADVMSRQETPERELLIDELDSVRRWITSVEKSVPQRVPSGPLPSAAFEEFLRALRSSSRPVKVPLAVWLLPTLGTLLLRISLAGVGLSLAYVGHVQDSGWWIFFGSFWLFMSFPRSPSKKSAS